METKADYEAFGQMNEQMADEPLTQARDLLEVLRKRAEGDFCLHVLTRLNYIYYNLKR